MPSRLKKSDLFFWTMLLIALFLIILILFKVLIYYRRVYTLNLEHFAESSDYKSALKHYKNLNERLDKIENIIENNVKTVENIESKFDGFKSEICYILTHVNDSLKGNYVSNVPEDEYKLDKEAQAIRKAKRRAKSDTYIKDIQDQFVKRYYLSIFKASPEYKEMVATMANKEFAENQILAKIDTEIASGKRQPPPNILECFSSISNDEIADLELQRANLNERISNIYQLLDDLKYNINSLKRTYGGKTKSSYDVTLKYNDKYLNKLLSEIGKNTEGFVDSPQEDPVDLINKLEKDCGEINNDIANTNTIVLYIEKNIVNQKQLIKQSKRIITDTKYQNNMLEITSRKLDADK